MLYGSGKDRKMRRTAIFFAAVFLMMSAACGSTDTSGQQQGQASGSTAQADTGIKGETVDKPYCSVFLPSGWTLVPFDDSETLQLINEGGSLDNQVVAMSVMGNNVTESENKELFEAQMKSYNAEFKENRMIGGVDCMCAVYTTEIGGGTYQYTQYQGLKDGRQISVEVCNMDVNDETVKAILDSMNFKTNQ